MATCGVCGATASAPFRFCPECGAPAEPEGSEQRKVVTVLFCDVVGSTALGESLDPEALRVVLARYFEQMKAIVERHDGTVEKFIGDAVMAVFGLPAVHEDDALRAVRAATAMQAALPDLGLEGRIGITTGEVVTGTQERLATGDAVNVAARLQQAARPGEILLGETTLRLTRDAVTSEPLEALPLKGKQEPVPAFRLVSVSTADVERAPGSPLVGRERELELLTEAWERVRAQGHCELVTLVAPAGVGKSRLVAEFVARTEPSVVRGRCLSYGEEITYWPVVEVLKQLEPRRSALELDPAASETLAVLVGQEGIASTDEIAWAFRKLLEAAAREQPLVAVFDDIQWAADTFLDLVEHLALLSTGAPILLLCMARPELLDRREGWAGVVRLDALDADETERLLDARIGAEPLGSDVRERILRAAGGNPLFVEEMVAMLQESGDGGEVAVPPTIQALLAARLDQLETGERTVLQHGSVEGELFHSGAVQTLTPDEPRLTARLTALVRRELVRPDKPLLPGDDAFRFRHLLIRDAAYDATPKARRAELHERFAAWLEDRGKELVELDELVGHHLEQAYRYRQELGLADENGRRLAMQGGERLRAAGSRALERGDFRAAIALLERAADLLVEDQRDADFEVALAWARLNAGRAAAARSGLADAVERAAAAGNRLLELHLRLEAANYDVAAAGTEGAPQRLHELVADAQPVFEAAGYEGADAVAASLLLLAEDIDGRSQAAIVAAGEHLVEVARRVGDRLFADWGEQQAFIAHCNGSTPVEACLRWLDAHPRLERSGPTSNRAVLLAMLGRFEDADRVLAEVGERLAERGAVRLQAFFALRRFQTAMLEADPARAAEAALEGYETLEAAGERGNLMWFGCNVARALYQAGRYEEAENWLRQAREEPSEELLPRMLWPQTQAKLLARRGEHDQAEALAREAVALAGETDMLNAHADALSDLAEVLTLAGKDGGAELEQALALYERKGNVAMANRVRARLEAHPAAG